MCGIAGIINLKKSVSRDDLIEANYLLRHRGPDAEGYYISKDQKVAFAHSRLSIIDLSGAANQPMFSASGRYVIIYNGEVYNYKDLYQHLPGYGKYLKTTSDTEVIIELFDHHGTESFKWLNGMFSFAIYDIELKNVTLCRDHVGIKPLFIYFDKEQIIFGSELKVIKQLKKNELSLNREAVPFFLHLGFIPEPLSIYNNVEKFPAGHFVQIDTTKDLFDYPNLKKEPFWNLEKTIQKDIIDEGPAKKQLNDLLIDSVSKQLMSDVPIGTFLSGGVDSSLVTAVASKVSDSRVKTFSISIDDGKFNESSYAKQVSDYLKTDHHEFKVKQSEVLELIDRFLPAYDEPFADSSAFPTMMVSRLARKHVSVTLSGDGGDELFHGYGMHLWARKLNHPVLNSVRWPVYYSTRILPGKYRRAGELFAFPSQQNKITHIFSQEQYYFSENELRSILNGFDFSFVEINCIKKTAKFMDATEKQALWDFNHYLKDDLLVKVDRASMQFSLETRVPLLDHRIVEFAFNLRSDLKINKSVMKYLLKEVLYDYLPEKIFNRPKWGFSIPLIKWLKTDLRFLLDKYTSKEIIEKYNLLHYESIKVIRRQYLGGMDYLFHRLWLIIVLHWWLEEGSELAHL